MIRSIARIRAEFDPLPPEGGGTDFGKDTYPMVQNNKVLTVSYGTFSCTLEGFDDSFGTMKAIAEYFRDLASDDRYFGAEPPQPDADMLARIAQKEIARQVEARTSDEGIHLRAATTLPAPQPAAAAMDTTADAPAAVQTPAAEPVPAADPVLEADPAPAATPSAPQPEIIKAEPIKADITQAEDVTTQDTAAQDAVVQNTKPAVSADSIAAKLRRIRAVVAQTPAEEFTEDQHADALRQTANAATTDTAPVEAAPVDGTTVDNLTVDSAIADIQSALAADDAVAADAPDLAGEALEHDDLTGDILDETDDAIADALDRIDAQVDQVEQVDQGEPAAQDPAAITASMNTPAEAEAFFAHSDSVDSEIDAGDSDDVADDSIGGTEAAPAPRRTARIARVKRRDLEAALASGTLEEVETPDPIAADAIVTDASDDTEATAAEVAEAPQSDRARPAAAKRAEAKHAGLEPDNNSSLSEEDEADLLAELAAVEAELLGTDGETDGLDDITAGDADQHDIDLDEMDLGAMDLGDSDAQDDLTTDIDAILNTDLTDKTPERPAAPLDLGAVATRVDADPAADADAPSQQTTDRSARKSQAQKKQAQVSDTADSDIARLMAATDAKLEDPETSSQRETYSQLRAVMAAASAEKSAGGSMEQEDASQVYRDDLASVVRPRRPSGAKETSRRPEPTARAADAPRISRPAPLKLVQEQRINDDAPADSAAAASAPVRPRRVSAALLEDAAPQAGGNDGGFAAYAADSGAVELAELLEAAAAYMSFVEGRDHFSRPQLMNKVRGVDGTDFNREDGLRSFGQLLRDGKIERADNGRFTASGQIGFQPGDRAAG
ncbi:chemotaxis protein CheA [Phaeobacter sp.]|uniref:chemotaxis protein CheA n=1 Tax=Phaeobacter sp. TaxID=1902409 RepID=UPI0025F4B014|nr:chemotaxis protein CheA [Phaeobacter sp.]